MRMSMNLQCVWRASLLGVMIAVACVLPADATPLNLLINGDFESPSVPPTSMCGPYANCLGFHNGVAGNDNIGGWQLIGKGGVDANGTPIPGAPATVLLLGYDYTEP